jgi:putative membrane protein
MRKIGYTDRAGLFGLLLSEICFKKNWFLHLLILVFSLYWIALSISPYAQFNWWLENVLTIITILVLICTYKYIIFSNLSYLMIVFFLALHTYGAHYSYTTTPIDEWLLRLFEFERNQYDRIVHFSFGLFLVYPLYELVHKSMNVSRFWLYALPILFIFAAGSFYELIEMWVAHIVAPEIGLNFVGFQGDVWDAQKDMALALYGSILTMVIFWVLRAYFISHDITAR